MAVRQKETHKNIGRDNYRQNDGETFRNSDKQTERHKDIQTKRLIFRQRQTNN